MNWKNSFIALHSEANALKAAWDAQATRAQCAHQRQELRRSVIRGGSVQIVHQCMTCGEKIGGPVAHEKAMGLGYEGADFNHELAAAYQSKNVKALNPLQIEERKREQWWGLYSEYLNSIEWRAKRRRALERDSGLCQACRSNEASEVHHTSYRYVGSEPLYDLVSVCKSCHDDMHAYDHARQPGEFQ